MRSFGSDTSFFRSDEKQTVLRDLWRLRLKEDADGNLVCRATPVAMAPALPPRFGHKVWTFFLEARV